jgi:hypothetical protein
MEALTWKPADMDGLVAYLVNEKQFSEERVRSAVEKMNAARGKATQNRLESFFKVRYFIGSALVHEHVMQLWLKLMVAQAAPTPAKPVAKPGAKRKEPPGKTKGKVAKKLGKSK